MERKQLLASLEAARRHAGVAAAELDVMMRELQADPPELRAHKTTISQVMQEAFDKLREARDSVAKLEELVSHGGDSD